MLRGAIYYDGFNLYHAVDELDQPYLKWCDLWKLGELVAKGKASSIERAIFCTAYFPGNHGKRIRHEAYVNALALVGVETRLGHTTKEPMECAHPDCDHRWDQPREKETDINLALAVYEDAHDDAFDVAFIVTADTDQAATFRAIKLRFPDKRIVNVIPPARHPSKHLLDLAQDSVKLKAAHLDECTLPEMVIKEGEKTIIRPHEYDPPEGWVHPDERPKGKPPKAPRKGAWGKAAKMKH